jgi:hypothetical protein
LLAKKIKSSNAKKIDSPVRKRGSSNKWPYRANNDTPALKRGERRGIPCRIDTGKKLRQVLQHRIRSKTVVEDQGATEKWADTMKAIREGRIGLETVDLVEEKILLEYRGPKNTLLNPHPIKR